MAERIAALQAKLADALKTGVKLDEARLNPNAARAGVRLYR